MMDFVQRVRDSRTAQARRQALQRFTYDSVVQEESVPQLALNIESVGFIPARKRALCPQVRVPLLIKNQYHNLGYSVLGQKGVCAPVWGSDVRKMGMIFKV